MIPKLSAACCAIRPVVHIGNSNTLKSIYCAYLHSVIKYGIILGGNFSNSGKIFTLQNKTVRIITGAQLRTSCKVYLNYVEILRVPYQYILCYELHCQ
jgi:hypothetical protein